jgi:hypothetical protein
MIADVAWAWRWQAAGAALACEAAARMLKAPRASRRLRK